MKLKAILTIVILLGIATTFQAQEPNDDTVYKWFQVQEKASYPGGDMAMDEFIKDNMVIPDVAYEKAKSGSMVVKFIVEKNGSLSDIHITSTRTIGFGCEEAYINVIKKMPKWIPAKQNGALCRMEFQKPIRLSFN